MSLHGILGYGVIAMAGLGFVGALAALLTRSATLERLMFAALVAGALLQAPAIITGVANNAAGALSAARVAPYNFFLAASLFTLSASLAVWRFFNPGVVWAKDQWLIFQAGALGNLALAAALAFIGRLAAA